MGQDITISSIESGSTSSHIYSLNRSLTGMEIVNYSDPGMDVNQNYPADVIAKKLLDLGVESVSIYSNAITVNCEPEVFEKIQSDIASAIENLFRHY